MTVSSIAVKKAAGDAVKEANVTPISSTSYSTEEFQKFQKGVISALSAVPSSYSKSGKGGHAGLILDDAKWNELIGESNATFTLHPQPTMATLDDKSTLAMIELAKFAYEGDLEEYYIQEGCEAGAKLLIEANVPEEALADLEDADTGFATVTARQMMAHLEGNATVTDVFDKEQLYAAAQEPYDFGSTSSFKVFATTLKRHQKVLKAHAIVLHDSVMMMSLLSQFKGHGGFKKEVEEWEVKSQADQTWVNFVKHFDAADHARRQRNKYGKKTAGESMYSNHQANQAFDMSDMKNFLSKEIDRKIGQGLTQVIDATEKQLEEQAHVATDKWSKSSSDELSKLREQMKALEDENSKLKASWKSRNGRRGRTRLTVGGEATGKKKMDTKCSLCNRWHPYVAEADCWAHPHNRDKAPEGWKKADE